MRVSAILLAVAVLLAACEHATQPVEPGAAAFHHNLPQHPNALVEGAWGENHLWELVKPRPPGIGGQPIDLYIIAPVDEGNPLSPPFEIPGVISVGGRDHVVPLPKGNQGTFRGVGRSVPLHVPGWEPCAEPTVDETRIAWRWVETPHPCGQEPLVYAVRLEGEECRKPLASVERVLAPVEQGLAVRSFPPEPPWPFAIRPLTKPGQGRVVVQPPECVYSTEHISLE